LFWDFCFSLCRVYSSPSDFFFTLTLSSTARTPQSSPSKKAISLPKDLNWSYFSLAWPSLLSILPALCFLVLVLSSPIRLPLWQRLFFLEAYRMSQILFLQNNTGYKDGTITTLITYTFIKK